MTEAVKPTIALLQTQAEAGGAQEIARILGNAWSAKGIHVHHCFFFRRTGSYDDMPNVYFAYPERPLGVAQIAKMAAALLRHLRIMKPDAVLTFQHYGNIIGAPIARAAGVKNILANLNSPWTMLPAWVLAIDWVLAASGIYSRVIANSANTAADFGRLPPPFARRLCHIDHGFEPKISDKSKPDARHALGLPNDTVLLGTVGRLHAQKNQAAVIALLPKNPCWHFAIAGQGELLAELRSLSLGLGCQDRMHLVGELAPEMISVFLNALDVFVFPSRVETFGLAVVEAAQSGVPVVCNDIEVLREVLQIDGEPCVRFVNVDDPSAFESAIREATGQILPAADGRWLFASAQGRRRQPSLTIAPSRPYQWHIICQ
jgi:glycosyltransferase involved in cell wall biosynthesis